MTVTWLAVIAGLMAIAATYWDGAWHTYLGRDSTFAAPHLLLYGSIVLAAVAAGAWAMAVLIAHRSVPAMFRNRALMLAAVALAAIAGSAVLDVVWHEYFGRDSVLWSPPHLLGVIGSLVLIVGFAISGAHGGRGRLNRVLVGVVLLSAAMLPVMEYDSRVPQFSELLYFPIVVIAALFATWVVEGTIDAARVMTLVVLGVILVRVIIWGVLTGWGWPAVDVPFALLGLVAFDLPRVRAGTKRALAAIVMSLIQLMASLTGLSSVSAESILPSAVVVLLVASGWLLIAHRSGRGIVAAGAIMLVAASLSVDAAPALAHDPGQGTDRGEVSMTVERQGPQVHVTVEPVTSSVPIRLERIVARRAGEIITATIERPGAELDVYRSSIDVADDAALWFIYAEFSSSIGPLESWITVEPDGVRADVRPLYQPPVTPIDDVEFIAASTFLYILTGAVLLLAVRAVQRSKDERFTRSLAQ